MIDRVAGGAIVVFGAWFLWQAASLREGPGYAVVGPRVFPVIVGMGLAASGLALAITGSRARGPADGECRSGRAGACPPPRSRRGTSPRPTESDGESAGPIAWSSLAQVAALLAAYVAAFLPLGFIVSSAVLVVAGAWALGSRRWLRDLTTGVLLSVVSYAVFTLFLGLELPAGPLEEPLRILRGYPQ